MMIFDYMQLMSDAMNQVLFHKARLEKTTGKEMMNMNRTSRTEPRRDLSSAGIVKPDVPIWRKYTLTIEEAAEYFRIGQKRLRQIVSEDPHADFILQNGNRIQIKRKKFEDYVDRASAV